MIARVHLDSGTSFLVDDTRKGVEQHLADAAWAEVELVLYDALESDDDIQNKPLRRVKIAGGTVCAVEDAYV